VREIAYTNFGRNALFTGLISHIVALLAGMMPVSGAQTFFLAAYGFACLAFALGVYVELKNKGYAPVRSLNFYGSAAVAVLPVIGPVATLLILYAAQGEGQGERFTVWDMFAAIPRLKVNPLVLLLFLAILFIFFAFSIRQDDPYFKRVKAENMFIGQQTDRVYC
jgi:hypothetical protein